MSIETETCEYLSQEETLKWEEYMRLGGDAALRFIAYCKDEQILKEIAKNDNEWCRRRAALHKINDQTFIVERFQKEKYWFVSLKIIPMIDDVEFLQKLSRNSRNYEFRSAARERLKELGHSEPSFWSRWLSFFSARQTVPSLPPSLFTRAKRIQKERTVSHELLLQLGPAIASYEADKAIFAEWENMQKEWEKELSEVAAKITHTERLHAKAVETDAFVAEDRQSVISSHQKTKKAIEQTLETVRGKKQLAQNKIAESEALFQKAVDSEQLFIECSASDYQVEEQQKRLAHLAAKTDELAKATS